MTLAEPPETTVRRIQLVRAITLWGLRLVGLVMVIRGIYLCVNRVAFGLSLGQVSLGWSTYTQVGEGHMLAAGIAATMIGLATLLVSRPLSRVVIAMPDLGCPACTHTGEVDRVGRCVECGCRLESANQDDPGQSS